MPRRKQNSYTVKEKQVCVLLARDVGVEEAARVLGYPRGSVFTWNKQAESLLDFRGPKTSKTLKGQGRKEIFPSVSAVVTFMKDVRRDEKVLSTNAIIDRMCAEDPEWVTEYIASRKCGVLALERLCQRLANRHGFSSQKPQSAKKSLEELQMVRAEFALSFWSRDTEYQSGGTLNVDETGINFDMPPLRAWALKGRKDPAHIIGLKKHTGRMTAVLTTRADGAKLPILFIVRGKPGGRIEKKEIPVMGLLRPTT
uniref:DDE-1 domain-containing protein n=1 Tax=Phytophthora ramorum TaxID=164328 RepID=H3GT21_PHYRM